MEDIKRRYIDLRSPGREVYLWAKLRSGSCLGTCMCIYQGRWALRGDLLVLMRDEIIEVLGL
jgi:hypothetical protein